MILKWGIVGFGKIASDFMVDLSLSEQNELYGIASRSQEKALELQGRFGLKKAYPNYEAIFKDPEIDIVYIATPHDSHAALSILAMNHGKHVLCEKPAGINAKEMSAMIETSIKNKVFFMEALWTRFNPNIEKILELIHADKIGKIRHIHANFCFYKDFDASSRLFDINRAGGALLDIGIYPLFLSYLILGKPDTIMAHSVLHDCGVDLQSSGILGYQEASSSFQCSTIIPSKVDAFILGEKGRIEIDSKWHEADAIRLITPDREIRFAEKKIGRGFFYEIEACYSCIRNHKIESERWSHQHGLELIQIMDEIRQQCGIIYPMEL